tara:strand:+ start:2014 stop:2484 length:471 start_codon:yes stop_codon:yes gene_type:complete
MELFDIPRKEIPSRYSLEKSGVLVENYWGKGCGYRDILDKNIAKRVLKYLPSTTFTKNLDDADVDIRYITYNVKNSYTIDYHNDYCAATLIIYMYKDPDMIDRFYVDGNKVEGQWKCSSLSSPYKALLFNGYKEHGGVLVGDGVRNVLVIHFDSSY